MIEKVLHILSSTRFDLNREKVSQDQVADALHKHNIGFHREYRLDDNNIPDFFILEGIAVEVKIKGNAKNIYKQCERYCGFEVVNSLILLTNRSMGFPTDLKGKPTYLVNMGKAWL